MKTASRPTKEIIPSYEILLDTCDGAWKGTTHLTGNGNLYCALIINRRDENRIPPYEILFDIMMVRGKAPRTLRETGIYVVL